MSTDNDEKEVKTSGIFEADDILEVYENGSVVLPAVGVALQAAIEKKLRETNSK
jgi:hypothetical protein